MQRLWNCEDDDTTCSITLNTLLIAHFRIVLGTLFIQASEIVKLNLVPKYHLDSCRLVTKGEAVCTRLLDLPADHGLYFFLQIIQCIGLDFLSKFKV